MGKVIPIDVQLGEGPSLLGIAEALWVTCAIYSALNEVSGIERLRSLE